MQTNLFKTIGENELVEYLLNETGQTSVMAVDPDPILAYLDLKYLILNFPAELPEAISGGECPRALLSVADKLIATSCDLTLTRARFSTFHEIGHYVLPEHVEAIVLCTDRDMSYRTQRIQEQQANAFAANLLFHGGQFAHEANSRTISARTVAELARNYGASFEATARRLVEKNFRPCMLLTYGKVQRDSSWDIKWEVIYSTASPAFEHRFIGQFENASDDEYVTRAALGCDITDSIISSTQMVLLNGNAVTLQAEYFTNQYCVFCLLQPA